MAAGVAYPVWRPSGGWMVRGSNTDGGTIFRARPDRPRWTLSHPYKASVLPISNSFLC